MLNPEIRIPNAIYAEMMIDLQRGHPFAGERVGFAYGKYAPLSAAHSLILVTRYEAIPDGDYVESYEYEALIGQEAVLRVMQSLRSARGTVECALHVHLHGHKGRPEFSHPDRRGLPRLIPGFSRMSPDGAHGLLLLSQDSASGEVWLPGDPKSSKVKSVTIVGHPTRIFAASGGKR